MLPYGFIYITTNLVNGKRYIGQCSYSKRKWKTYLGSGSVLKKAIAKYGREFFSREIICDAFTKADLSWLEIHFISDLDAVKDEMFYNIAEGGYVTRGFTGKIHSEEYKHQQAEYGRLRPATDKMRSNMSMIGKKHGGFWNTDTHFKAVQNTGLANKGKHWYTDGQRAYCLHDDDPLIVKLMLSKGRKTPNH